MTANNTPKLMPMIQGDTFGVLSVTVDNVSKNPVIAGVGAVGAVMLVYVG